MTIKIVKGGDVFKKLEKLFKNSKYQLEVGFLKGLIENLVINQYHKHKLLIGIIMVQMMVKYLLDHFLI